MLRTLLLRNILCRPPCDKHTSLGARGQGLVGGRGGGQAGGRAKEGGQKRGMLKHLLILILPSLSMLTRTLTCLTSCWTALVKAVSMIEILIRRVKLQSVDVNVKMKCINFSLELTSWWRCKTSTPSSTTIFFLGRNHQLTNSIFLKGLLSNILQFLQHLLHLSISGAKLQESSLLNEIGCRRRLLLQ